MTTPRLSIEEPVEGTAGNAVTVSRGMRWLEALLAGELKSSVVATPPGSPADGDLYLVAASPTGAWTGQAGKLALRLEGAWQFRTVKGGMQFFDVAAKELVAYSSVESLWFPVQPRWSTTEHWTGMYRNGKKVWSKVVAFGAVPGAMVKSVAHGITGIDFSEHVGYEVSVGSAAGGINVPVPQFGTPVQVDYIVNVSTTYVDMIPLGLNYAAAATAHVRLTYAK